MTISKGALCLLTATVAIALRVGLYDVEFFTLARWPNHDMSQGAGFFVANLHSLRLSGEIAWWKSNLLNGYAHYYQIFFSPLAPTPGHVVFIVYAQLVLVLDVVGLRISEYFHYLIVTYVVLPWLAVAGFCWLVSLFVEGRLAILFAGIVYALSGIGLWMGAWFYFQEPATLNFLLAASVALMRRPDRAQLLVWLSAVMIQAASVSYWTVYNVFFVAVFLGGYVLLHLGQARDALLAAARGWRPVAWALGVIGVWGVLLGSSYLEQHGRYVRATVPDGYTSAHAIARARLTPLPDAAALLVDRQDPALRKPAQRNAVHKARYIGALTILLAVCALLFTPRRTAVWLALCAAAVTWITTAPQPMVWLWESIPTMDRIQHLFYMYPHVLAQLLVMLAAIGLDRIIGGARLVSARATIAGAALLASAVDLSLYYRAVSRIDGDFTANVLWRQMHPMTPERQRRLATPLPPLDPTFGFEGGVGGNFPLVTPVFPTNLFVIAREVIGARVTGAGLTVGFIPNDATTPVPVTYRPAKWTYNTFTFEIDAPADGRIYVAQLFDAAWTYSVGRQEVAAEPREVDPAAIDPAYGKPTAPAATAIPISAGTHTISMDYQPIARRLYWPAAILLQVMLLFFVVTALRSREEARFPA